MNKISHDERRRNHVGNEPTRVQRKRRTEGLRRDGSIDIGVVGGTATGIIESVVAAMLVVITACVGSSSVIYVVNIVQILNPSLRSGTVGYWQIRLVHITAKIASVTAGVLARVEDGVGIVAVSNEKVLISIFHTLDVAEDISVVYRIVIHARVVVAIAIVVGA